MENKSKGLTKVKKNSKPSSSSRSAELLGSQKCIAFPTQTHKKLQANNIVQFGENFFDDSPANKNLQNVIRKLNKKDPTTKKKALEELIHDINAANVEDVSSILPLWTKVYLVLAYDPIHNVRELTQEVQKLIASKSKRMMAPYLKQLIPVWIFSCFDNYTAAAYVARASLFDTFKANRIQEVCLHCQLEILEYVRSNLLESLDKKMLAENYFCQNKVYGSLEVLSFFTEHTITAELSSESYIILRSILEHKSFWAYGKSGAKSTRVAWFKVITNLIQTTSCSDILLKWKWEIIEISFNAIDDCDRRLSCQVWNCVLVIQSTYADWHKNVDLKVTIQPKLSSIFQNNFFNNYENICPKLLSFCSAIISAYYNIENWHLFFEQFLSDFKQMFSSQTLNAREKEHKIIFNAYFDCLSFVLNKLNGTEKQSEEKEKLLLEFMQRNIIQPIEWLINANENATQKLFFDLTVKMLSDIKPNSQNEGRLPENLLSNFWTAIFDLISSLMSGQEHYPQGIINLFENLVGLNERSVNSELKYGIMEKDIESKLKKVAAELVYHCLRRIANKDSPKCVKHVLAIVNTFPDSDSEFFENIAKKCDIVEAIKIFFEVIPTVEKEMYKDVAEVIFKFLNCLDEDQQFTVIKTHIFSIRSSTMQILILEQLFLQSLNIGKNKELLLSCPEIRELLIKLTKSLLINKPKETINWLNKLFLQNGDGKFYVGSKTVDTLVCTIFESTEIEEKRERIELSADIILQLIPKLFSLENVLIETKQKIFLKLFTFILQKSADSLLTEDALLKLTLCWENILCDENIVTEKIISECTTNLRFLKKFTIASTLKCADLAIRLIVDTTRKSTTNETSYTKLNNRVRMIVTTNDISELQEQLSYYASSIEAIKGIISTKEELRYQYFNMKNVSTILQRALLNVYIIKGMYNNLNNEELEEESAIACNLSHELLNCIYITSTVESVLQIQTEESNLALFVKELQDQIKTILQNETTLSEKTHDMLIHNAKTNKTISHSRSLPILISHHRFAQFEESAAIIFIEEMFKHFCNEEDLSVYINVLQYQIPELSHRSVSINNIFHCAKSTDIWLKCSALRCLVINYFKHNEMEAADKVISGQLLGFAREISEKLLTEKAEIYDTDINKLSYIEVVELIEYIRLLTEMLKNMPWCLGSKEWDSITIGLSSWVPSILKSAKNLKIPQVALFTVHVCKLFSTFVGFMNAEKNSSSTLLVKKTIDEWCSLFAKDVNCKLFQSFYELLKIQENFTTEYFSLIFSEIRPSILHLDLDAVYLFCKNSSNINLKNMFDTLLQNFSNPNIIVRRTCYYILRELTNFYVVDDSKNIHSVDNDLKHCEKTQHFLQLFESFIISQQPYVDKYLLEFSFKITEIDEFSKIDREKAFTYLLMWDCIIHACVKSPLAMRTIYTSWLYENKFFEKFLHFVIRLMPIEILKNHDNKFLPSEIFNILSWEKLNDENLTLERYACHLYTEVLKKLPAVVRKWWNISSSRQKTFVDRLTTNFVSPLICEGELSSISANKEKNENMQVTVHFSTREVIAVYFIDEVRTELTIVLPSNYPLGPVKVDCGKNIGGRLSSRNDALQLALFLNHQNGTILDGLALWKNTLDKKFEGVEECYVCYTVIHQDTCQLPKLTCKTCKKKFHGPCLYKWFTTSSKSTCPICRNVF
ncbi:unnamed protein product [Ceratitis capitata]|uniref:E3 ubiquitin-protein ligase listerin n=3 Tax=Ceratitis capitata TaxID=7213 RepID=W8BRR3_CERCA|nr:unnamed protein product [Ceratitis capitata]